MVKGLSIMTLFFLHFENGWMEHNYNYFIVRSPAFFIVVGWLWGMSSNKKTLSGHWTKRKEGLVKPYLWLSFIFLCFDALMIILGQYDLMILEKDLFKTIILRGIGTLWFLPALLGGEMLFIYLSNKEIPLKVFSFIFCFSIILVFKEFSEQLFPNSSTLNFASKSLFRVFKDICDAYIYISVAFYISREVGRSIFNFRKKYIFLMGITLLIIAFYILNYTIIHDSKVNNIVGTTMFIIANCCSGFGILLLFRSIEWFKPLSLPLSYCGKNSLIIMAFHFCILFQVTLIIDHNILGYTDYCGRRTIIYFLIALITQIAIIEIINKNFRFIIGKK